MAVVGKWFGQALLKALNKEIAYTTDTIKVMLCTNAYTPDQDAHVYKSAVTNEVVGTGYTAGGVALAGKTLTYTAATNVIMLDANDVSWANSTITARYAVIYADTGVAGTSPLLGFVDFGADVTSSGGPFSITWDAAGLLTCTPA